jgi:hypothetical protein
LFLAVGLVEAMLDDAHIVMITDVAMMEDI